MSNRRSRWKVPVKKEEFTFKFFSKDKKQTKKGGVSELLYGSKLRVGC